MAIDTGPFYFEAEEAGAWVAFGANGLLVCSTDNSTWTDLTTTPVTLAAVGDRLYVRAKQAQNNFNYCHFSTNRGRVGAHGSVMWLLDPTGQNQMTLGEYAFEELFYGCGNLTTAPSLPATTLANGCYHGMFLNCSNLTAAPELPATTLTEGCYNGMFAHCTSLTTAPALPATTLAEGCYEAMFYDCASLTTAPSLPATTLANGCYYEMFSNCTSLTTAPELPATTLANNCYHEMFYKCTSLTTAPELPATTLAENCYGAMFYNCASLTTAPELPATTLAIGCYGSMFYNCTSLTEIPGIAYEGEITQGYTFQWLDNTAVNTTGTIRTPKTTTFASGVLPDNWTQEFIILLPFYFEAARPQTSITFPLSNKIQYSLDGTNWVNWTANFTINLNNRGDKLYVRAKQEQGTLGLNSLGNNAHGFIFTGVVEAHGSVMWLLDPTGQNMTTLTEPYALAYLFKNSSDRLLTVPELTATTLSDHCYYQMFYGCEAIETAPELPATTLASECYTGMFMNCYKLKEVELPATTLATQCYTSMFKNCHDLTSVKMAYEGEIPSATTSDWLSGAALNKSGVVETPMFTTFASGALPDNWIQKKEIRTMAAHLKLHDILSAADHAVSSTGTSILTTGQKGAVVYNEAGALSGMQIETTGSMIVTRDDNGRLFMSAAPTANDHVANKEYVDGQVSGGKLHDIFDATAHEVGATQKALVSSTQKGIEAFDSAGTFSAVLVDPAATANTLPIRDANGDITLNGSQAMTSGSMAATIDSVVRLAQAEIAASKLHEIDAIAYHTAVTLGSQLTDTTGYGVVTYNPSGVVSGQEALTTATANALVKRDANGQIYVPDTPLADGQAASKKYVDGKAAELAAGIWKGPTKAVVADITARDALTVAAGDQVVVLADDKVYTYDGTSWDAGYIPTISERRHDDAQDKDWAFDVEGTTGNKWFDLGATNHSRLHDMDSAADHNYTANTLYYGSSSTGTTAATLTFAAADAGKAIKVNSTGTALEFGPLSLAALANDIVTGSAVEPVIGDFENGDAVGTIRIVLGTGGNLFLAIKTAADAVKSVELA